MLTYRNYIKYMDNESNDISIFDDTLTVIDDTTATPQAAAAIPTPDDIVSELSNCLLDSLEGRMQAYDIIKCRMTSDRNWYNIFYTLSIKMRTKIIDDDISWYNYVELLLIKERDHILYVFCMVDVRVYGILELFKEHSVVNDYMKFLISYKRSPCDEIEFMFKNGVVPEAIIFTQLLSVHNDDDGKFEMFELFLDYFEKDTLDIFKNMRIHNETIKSFKYWVARGGNVGELNPYNVMRSLINCESDIISAIEESGYDFTLLNNAWKQNDYMLKMIDKLGINIESVNVYLSDMMYIF